MENEKRNLKLKMKNENRNQYSILDLDLGIEIGEINFTIENQLLIIEFMTIYPPYRRKYYGTEVIDYLMENYNFIFITGESTKSAKKFWGYNTVGRGGMIVKGHKLANTVETFYIRKEICDARY